jgi:hypothetical protein
MTIEWTSVDRGEAPIWSGRPAPLRYAVSRSWDTFLFGICFFGVTLGALVSQIGKADAQLNLPFWLFWVAFMTTGAAMVPPPFRHLWRGLRAEGGTKARRGGFVVVREVAHDERLLRRATESTAALRGDWTAA